MTTPIEKVEILRMDFLKEIELFFKENDIKEIEFEVEPNDIDTDLVSLSNQGILGCVDEFGNEYDEKLNELNVMVIAHVLTLIHDRKFDVI